MEPEKEISLLPPRRAIQEMRFGNIEPVADYIERGAIDTLAIFLTQEDRQRLSRALRTGSPLTRSEKRQNSEACKVRDLFLISRLFYWFGEGAPGFSHTADDTAFHYALRDYEKHQINGAPLRTPESLYRHVWKPYLSRIRNNRLTDDDVRGCQRPPLGSFLYGLMKSCPTSKEEVVARLQWFERVFLEPDIKFYLSHSDEALLWKILEFLDLSAERWRQHVRQQTAAQAPMFIRFD